MAKTKRIALTGFMGVGKSSVARHLSHFLRCDRIDLDIFIEAAEGRRIVDILDSDGEPAYREIESRNLARVLQETKVPIISLGGGAWTVEKNRDLIKKTGVTSIWLESTFEHCWYNIRASRKERPLARDKVRARKLFDERQKLYCLADWHFIVKPESSSFATAKQILEEVYA